MNAVTASAILAAILCYLVVMLVRRITRPRPDPHPAATRVARQLAAADTEPQPSPLERRVRRGALRSADSIPRTGGLEFEPEVRRLGS